MIHGERRIMGAGQPAFGLFLREGVPVISIAKNHVVFGKASDANLPSCGTGPIRLSQIEHRATSGAFFNRKHLPCPSKSPLRDLNELPFPDDHRQFAVGVLEGLELVPDFVEAEDLGGGLGEGDAVVVADDFGGFEVAEFAGSAFGRGGADEFAGGDFVVLPPPGFGFAQELALFDRGAFAAFPADDKEASAVRGGKGFAGGFEPGTEFPGPGMEIIGIKDAPDGFLRAEAVHVIGDVLDDGAFGEALGDCFL